MNYGQLIAWSFLRFTVCKKTEIKNKFHSIIETIAKLWNGFFLALFSLIIWVLCATSTSGLCTKNNVISTQGNLSKTIDITEEEMTEQDVAYVRVSSREQAENTNALVQQRHRVLDAGAKQIFQDVQQGKRDDRPAFQQLLALVKRGKIRRIIITRIDRISRSLITLKKLVDTLAEYEVSLVILDQKMDLGTAQGKLLFNMLSVLAEWEVDLLSERVQNGKKHQRKQQWANGQSPWGYQVIDHKYVLDQTPFLCLLTDRPDNYLELSQVKDPKLLPGRTIAELARDSIDIFFDKKGARRALKVIFEKYGIVKTSAKFNGTQKIFHWTIPGFTLWLTNVVLDGHTSYLHSKTISDKRKALPQEEWQIIRDTHPDQRLFRDGEAAAVKIIIQTNMNNGSGCFKPSLTGSDNYRKFAYQIGLVYCSECSSRCTSKGCDTNNQEYLYYACRHAGIGCKNHKSVKRRHIEEALIEALVEKSQSLNSSDSTSAEVPPVYSEALACLEAQLAALEQVPGFNPDIDDLKIKLCQQIEEEKNPFLSQDQILDKSVDDLIRAGNNLAIWHLLNNDEKVEIYRKLVKKIYIRDGKVALILFN
jgi:DNA invertase Pin-like site-specific DNA recombinase